MPRTVVRILEQRNRVAIHIQYSCTYRIVLTNICPSKIFRAIGSSRKFFNFDKLYKQSQLSEGFESYSVYSLESKKNRRAFDMKFAIFFMLFAASLMATAYGAIELQSINQQENELYSVLDVDKEFEAWKAKHNVVYKNAKEEDRRKRIWLASRKMVEEHQKNYANGETSFQVTLNHLADLEPHEYSCWPRKTSCRHRHRLIRTVSSSSSRYKRDSEYKQRTMEDDQRERQGNQDGDKHERERIRDNNKDGRHGR